MRYNWDLKELEANRIILGEVYKKLDDKKLKKKVSTVIELYKNMTRIAVGNNQGEETFDKNYKSISVDDLINNLITTYNQSTIEYWGWIINSYFIVNKYNYNPCNVYDEIKINNDTLVNISMEFFKEMTTPTIANKFADILNDGTRIQINYEKNDLNYGGLILYEDIINKKYIYIRRANRLLDLSLLPHEAFHYIFMGNNGIIGNYNTKYLTEVEGMLANIIFTDYADKITENGTKYFKDYFDYAYQSHIYDIVVRYAILESITERNKISFDKLNKFLENIGFTLEEFKNSEQFIEYLSVPQKSTMTYTLSYLTALDLYYQYLNDREKAFYNLECLLECKKTNQLFKLLSKHNITFMNDDYENLKRYLKK